MNRLRELLGQYQKMLLTTVQRNSFRRACDGLETFFERFPNKKSPESFARCDVEDYRASRTAQGINQRTINFEVGTVCGFYNWLRNSQEEFADLPNPASRKVYRP